LLTILQQRTDKGVGRVCYLELCFRGHDVSANI
jgi:hypothetical protein